MSDCEEYIIQWNGPYDWPQLRQTSPLDSMSGVYLWTIKGDAGYVCSGCGITGRTIRQRVMEHRRRFLAGKATLLDLDSMRQGVRKEIWHGMWAGFDSDERKAEFTKRKEELQKAAIEQMNALQIFVAEIADQRIQERIESAIMQTLYQADPPYCDLPDRGTLELGRRTNESPMVFVNQCNYTFVNLATRMAS